MVPLPASAQPMPPHAHSRSGVQSRFTAPRRLRAGTMAALIAQPDRARYTANLGLVARLCESDDVVKCLDALYRRRRIDLARIWASAGFSPVPGSVRRALRLAVVERRSRPSGMADTGKGIVAQYRAVNSLLGKKSLTTQLIIPYFAVVNGWIPPG
jgi:hypothetical protein